MERSIKVFMAILALALCPSRSGAENFVAWEYDVPRLTHWEILYAYQVGSEVWVV
jgi:hypothetical protein